MTVHVDMFLAIHSKQRRKEPMPEEPKPANSSRLVLDRRDVVRFTFRRSSPV